MRRRVSVVVAVEGRVVAASTVVVVVLVVRERVNDDFPPVEALYRPGRVEDIEGVEEGGNEVHRRRAHEDEEDVANQAGSRQARHPALSPRWQGIEGEGGSWVMSAKQAGISFPSR